MIAKRPYKSQTLDIKAGTDGEHVFVRIGGVMRAIGSIKNTDYHHYIGQLHDVIITGKTRQDVIDKMFLIYCIKKNYTWEQIKQLIQNP
jgi:hypothetical protein